MDGLCLVFGKAKAQAIWKEDQRTVRTGGMILKSPRAAASHSIIPIACIYILHLKLVHDF